MTGAFAAIVLTGIRAPVLELRFADEVAIVVAAFGFKPVHMALSLALVALLWRQRARDLALIRNGLAALFAGELFCAVNSLAAAGRSDVLELFHGAGMVAMGALLSYGLFALLDDRVLRFSDPQTACAVQRLCKRCWKRDATSCPPHRLFLFVGPAVAILGLIPLSLPFDRSDLAYWVYGTEVLHCTSEWKQLTEFRVYPILGAVAMLASWIFLLRGRRGLAWAERAFFAGLGFVAYSLFRFLLFRAFVPNPGLASVWEEATELLAVLGIAMILWVFREPLGIAWPKRRGG